MTKRNHHILPLRKAIGASQGELADLLGITRTTLALTESGSRDIPAKARDRYVELEQWVIASEAAPQGSADEATAYTQQTVVKWQRDLKRYTYFLQKSEVMLRDAEQRYADAAASLVRLETFPAQTRAEQRWLGRLRRRHEATLRNNDLYVQMELRMRVESYRVRVGMLKGLLGM